MQKFNILTNLMQQYMNKCQIWELTLKCANWSTSDPLLLQRDKWASGTKAIVEENQKKKMQGIGQFAH